METVAAAAVDADADVDIVVVAWDQMQKPQYLSL